MRSAPENTNPVVVCVLFNNNDQHTRRSERARWLDPVGPRRQQRVVAHRPPEVRDERVEVGRVAPERPRPAPDARVEADWLRDAHDARRLQQLPEGPSLTSTGAVESTWPSGVDARRRRTASNHSSPCSKPASVHTSRSWLARALTPPPARYTSPNTSPAPRRRRPSPPSPPRRRRPDRSVGHRRKRARPTAPPVPQAPRRRASTRGSATRCSPVWSGRLARSIAATEPSYMCWRTATTGPSSGTAARRPEPLDPRTEPSVSERSGERSDGRPPRFLCGVRGRLDTTIERHFLPILFLIYIFTSYKRV